MLGVRRVRGVGSGGNGRIAAAAAGRRLRAAMERRGQTGGADRERPVQHGAASCRCTLICLHSVRCYRRCTPPDPHRRSYRIAARRRPFVGCRSAGRVRRYGQRRVWPRWDTPHCHTAGAATLAAHLARASWFVRCALLQRRSVDSSLRIRTVRPRTVRGPGTVGPGRVQPWQRSTTVARGMRRGDMRRTLTIA